MEVRPGYKLTEVGVIPEEWEVKQLGDIAQLKNGFSFRSSTYTPLGQFKVVTIASVQDGYMNATECNKVAALPRELQAHHRLRRGDVLISMTGNVGRVCRVTEDDCLLNQRVGKLVPSGIEDNLLFVLLGQRAFLAAMSGKAKGGAQGNLSKSDITEYRFPVPPTLPEQHAIARALSDVDALLGALERLIAKKRDLKQAAMQQLLTGQTRLPGFHGEWELKRLGSLGAFLKGSGVRKDEALSGDLPCVRYGEIYTHHHDVVRVFNTFLSSSVASAATPLRKGDLLFAASGETKEEIGKAVAFAHDYEAYAGGDIVILRPEASDSVFLGYYLNSPPIQKQKASRGQGDAVVHISATSLAAIEVTVPFLPEQTAIATVLTDMDAELAALTHRLTKTRALKQGMMQELLTGRTRLVAAEDAS
jgi:type I restriction enzyme S subunit